MISDLLGTIVFASPVIAGRSDLPIITLILIHSKKPSPGRDTEYSLSHHDKFLRFLCKLRM